MGAANLAELTAVGPSGTLLCYSCTPRAREVQPPPPDLQPTMGHPGQPELLSCPPHRLPDPEATALGTAGAVGVHAQHFIGAGRGKTNALSAAD